MSQVEVGKVIPSIKVQATGDQVFKLSELKGNTTVLYFYPKDNTAGCTREGEAFRDNYRKFQRRKIKIFGISRDSLTSHEKFKDKHRFPFDLIADPEEKLCKLFGVIKEKNMYGRKVMGIERSTFIFDKKGVLRKVFRKVKVDGHVDEVLLEASKL